MFRSVRGELPIRFICEGQAGKNLIEYGKVGI
jgi:hypothetical protein